MSVRRRWDAVVKVSGSLYTSPSLPALMRALAATARRRRLLVVPGGGPFADAVREAWRRHRLSEAGAHRMALLGMDQLGLLLCDLEPAASPVRTLEEGARAARSGRLPVLLAARLAAAARGLPARWSVTSDSVSAWVAARAGAPRLVLLKSVDAVAGSGRQRPLLPARLAASGVVDASFPDLLPPTIDCWVVNGRFPSRVGEFFEGEALAGRKPRAVGARAGKPAERGARLKKSAARGANLRRPAPRQPRLRLPAPSAARPPGRRPSPPSPGP